MRYHYSKRMPTPPYVFLGIWEDGSFIGAVIFSRGNAPTMHRQFHVSPFEVLELTRVALRAHSAPVSRIVSRAVAQLRKMQPNLRVLISFADPREGHHGGIYQAMGWTYLGTSGKQKAWLSPDGQLLHSRVVTQSGMVYHFWRKKPAWKSSECTPVMLPGKFRYALGLDKAMREFLIARAQPYPKRAPVVQTTEHSATSGEVGGSNPTPALQDSTSHTVHKVPTLSTVSTLPRRMRKRHLALVLRKRRLSQ